MSNNAISKSLQELKNLSADQGVFPNIPREGAMGKADDGAYYNFKVNTSGELVIDPTNLDSRYVNIPGDQMTGTLQINVPTTTTEALILKTTDDNATKNLFEVKTSAGVNLLEVDNLGYLGIGIDPTVPLEVNGNAKIRDRLYFPYSGSDTSSYIHTDIYGNLQFYSGNVNLTLSAQSGSATLSAYSTFVNIKTAYDAGVNSYVALSPANSEAVRVINSGYVGINETVPTAQLQINTSGTTVIGQIIKAAPSQTANLTEWQNSSGGVLASINSSGYLGIGINADSIVAVKATTTFAPASGTVYGLFSNITTNPSAGATSAYGSYSSIKVQNTNTQAITELYGIRGVVDAEDAAVTSAYGIYADVPSVDTGSITNAYGIFINDGVVGAGSTTTAYGLWFQNIDSATTNYAIYTNLGGIRFGDQLSVIGSQDITQSIIKANATQTANLTEWQNSSGTVLAQIEDDGRLYVNISDTVGSLGNFSYSSKLSRTFTGTNFGASANAYISTYNLANIQHSGTGTNPTVRALQNEVTVSVGGGSIKNIVGIYNNPIVNHASSTVTNAYGSWNVIQAFAGTITNAYGQFIGSPNTTGTITNNYGIYVANQSGADTLNYAIFTNAGKVRLGDELTTVGARIKSTETSTTTATINDSVEVHICNGASDYTLTLPAHVAGKEIRIINENAGVVTLSPTSGTIKGSATEMLYEWESLILISTGTNWV